MAEIAQQSGGHGHKGGKVRAKKMSTRIDFTPMVDLGFLLITFFMLTTTLNKPQTMEINLPVKEKTEQPPVKESKVLTLLLGAKDKVYYYEGITEPVLDSTDYSAKGARQVILDKKSKVESAFGKDETIVLIKPTSDAIYKNVVDMLDEMQITGIQRYVMIDISEAEKNFIRNPAAGLDFKPTSTTGGQ